MLWYWPQYVDVIDFNREHLIFIKLEDDAVYFPGALDAAFGTFYIVLMTYGLTSYVSFLPVTLLFRFSFGTLILNVEFLHSNLIWQIPFGREPNCLHSSFYYAGERVLSSPAVPLVTMASLLISEHSLWLLALVQWAPMGSRCAMARRYRKA